MQAHEQEYHQDLQPCEDLYSCDKMLCTPGSVMCMSCIVGCVESGRDI